MVLLPHLTSKHTRSRSAAELPRLVDAPGESVTLCKAATSVPHLVMQLQCFHRKPAMVRSTRRRHQRLVQHCCSCPPDAALLASWLGTAAPPGDRATDVNTLCVCSMCVCSVCVCVCVSNVCAVDDRNW